MKKLLQLLAVSSALISPANAAVYTILDSTGATQSFAGSVDGSSNLLPAEVICGNAALATLYPTTTNCAVVNASGQLLTLTTITGTVTTVNPSVSAFGAPGPANGNAIGANGPGIFDPVIQTHATLPINISTAVTTQLVALVASQKIYVTSWDVMAPSGNFTLEYGTGTLCGTGTTALTGPEAMAGGQVGKGTGLGPVLIIPASNALCVVTSAAVQYSGSLSYVQF